jgi:hypothetical protein
MHSHVVERAVNVASALVQKCGSHEREDRMSVKISAIINEQLVLQRAAVIEAEREREAAGGDRGWVTDLRGLARKKKRSVRGKRVLFLQIRNLQRKAGTLTATFVKEAKKAAATRRKQQTDRRSFTAKRIKDKIKNSQDKAANKKNAAATAAKVASAVAAAAAASPPKQLLNKLDLSSTKTAPSKAVLALELEARGLGAKVKRAGVRSQNAGCVMSKAQELVDALVAHHNGDTIIPKLTSFEGTKKSRSYDGDGTCRAFKRQQTYNQAAPAADGSAGAGAAGAGAVADMEEEAESDREPQGVDADAAL